MNLRKPAPRANDGTPARRGGAARSIGEALPGALRSLGIPARAVGRRVTDAWARASEGHWVGRATPDRIQGGVLFVRVSSAPLRQELAQFHAERLLRVLRTLLPDDPVISLRFVAGPVRDADASAEARHDA